MKKLLFSTLLILALSPAFAQKYVFYLHGAIVEGNCEHPVKPGFGEYKYKDIVAALKAEKFEVVSECRPGGTEVKQYAGKVVKQVEDLLKKGVKPSAITVVGASKGARIAMYVSTFLKNPKLNFVFLSNCTDGGEDDVHFYGNVLSIYEKSDDIAQSCSSYKAHSTTTDMPKYKEVALNTGRKHGYIFTPMPEWMKPVTKWANGQYD